MPNPLEYRDSDRFRCNEPYAGQVTYYDNTSDFIDAIRETGVYSRPVDVVCHELAHLECARAVGFRAASFNIEIVDDTPIAAVVTGLYSGVPRLAFAAFAIAPINPSDADFSLMQRFGYKSPLQVGEKIRAWNDKFDLQMPLPGALDPRS